MLLCWQNALLILLGGDSNESDAANPVSKPVPAVASTNQDLLDLLGKFAIVWRIDGGPRPDIFMDVSR